MPCPVPQEDDDVALMRGVAARDERAFERLVHRHLGHSARLAARVLGSMSEAEDVAQEAFIRVWQHAPAWKAEGALFTTWLHRIVLNLAIDHRRKRRFEPLDEQMPDGTAGAEKELAQKQQSARVRAVIAKLPERQRTAFVLCFYEERSNKEAAEMLGVSVKALESLLVRARRTLHEKLLPEKES